MKQVYRTGLLGMRNPEGGNGASSPIHVVNQSTHFPPAVTQILTGPNGHTVRKKLRTNSGASSEEVSLFHDPQELLFIDFTIATAVCFINHLLQFFVRHSLTKLLRNTLEVLE